MTLLDRYIGRSVIAGSLLVLLALTLLAAFFSLLVEFNNTGRGSYGMTDALLFVVLHLPRQAYELFPIAVLLGSLLGLGNLASSNELMVMRASGTSVLRLGGSVLAGAAVLAVLCALLGEVLAPPAERYARHMQNQELYNRSSLGAAQGIWVREGDSFANIRHMSESGELSNIIIYDFSADAENKLMVARQAESLQYTNENWLLSNVDGTRFRFQESGITAEDEKKEQLSWQVTLDPGMLNLFVVASETLSALELHRYINYLQASGLNAASYKMAFWIHLVIPVSVLVMAALALPFVFGPMRSAGVGQRVVFGLLIGIGFYVLNQILSSSGQVFGLPPSLVAWVPTVLVGAGTVLAMKRIP